MRTASQESWRGKPLYDELKVSGKGGVETAVSRGLAAPVDWIEGNEIVRSC